MAQTGYVQCFLFEQHPVRGCVARLDPVWQGIQAKRDDPPFVRQYLGEMLAACALLSAHLKFEGSLSLQLMGDGPLSLLVAEYRSPVHLRATARFQSDLPVADDADFAMLVGPNARFAVIIDQGKGEPWQGVVPVEAGGIAASLQAYFEQSEQLKTDFLLVADAEHCAGFLLQKMPDEKADESDWESLFMLAETLKPEELLRWDEMELLQKLFAEEDIRLFDAQPRRHVCTCSREGVERMIVQLGRPEVEKMLAEQGRIEVTCEFCAQTHVLDRVDVAGLFEQGRHAAPASRQ